MASLIAVLMETSAFTATRRMSLYFTPRTTRRLLAFTDLLPAVPRIIAVLNFTIEKKRLETIKHNYRPLLLRALLNQIKKLLGKVIFQIRALTTQSILKRAKRKRVGL